MVKSVIVSFYKNKRNAAGNIYLITKYENRFEIKCSRYLCYVNTYMKNIIYYL